MEIWICNQYSDERQTVKVDGEDITIGRDENNNVTLRSPFVSRRHARIFHEGGSYYVESLGLNGTIVLNKLLPHKHRQKIEYGDEIRIGEFSLYMMEPSARRIGGQDRTTTPRKRVIELEQKMHAELLERLNLRVTGQRGSADEQHVMLIKRHLSDIIQAHQSAVDGPMAEYLLQEFLWRGVVTELARRATGKLMYNYGFENTDVLVAKHEEAISRMIGDTLGSFPLRLRPHTIKEDAAMVEKGWPAQIVRLAPRVTPDLRDYIVRRMLSKEIEDVVLGYGPLQDLLEMPNVNEIMVVGRDRIYIEKDGSVQNTGRSFFNDEIVQSIIERIITPVGRRIDRSTPLVDARLPDGSRVNAIINPLSLAGPTLTIRKFARIPFTVDDLIERGTLTEATAGFLRACVMGRMNIIISGGTGSGKTTLLNTLSSFIPNTDRIVTIEDAAELQLQQDHVVRLETRPPNIEGKGAITATDLVRNALRMRPDRIIIGECRGAEALDMLQAMNTGHEGSMTTLHANSPRDALSRLETMIMMAGYELPLKAMRAQVASAIDVVVQASRLQGGPRKVTCITEIVGMEQDTIVMQDIYRYDREGVDENGRTYGKFVATGIRPMFMSRLESAGVRLPSSAFRERVMLED